MLVVLYLCFLLMVSQAFPSRESNDLNQHLVEQKTGLQPSTTSNDEAHENLETAEAVIFHPLFKFRKQFSQKDRYDGGDDRNGYNGNKSPYYFF